MLERNFEQLMVPEKFVILALAADRLVSDRPIVFNYFGPDYLKRYVPQWKKEGVGAIIQRLYQLEEDAVGVEDEAPFFRQTFLVSQIRSLRSLLEIGSSKLRGEHLIGAVKEVLDLTPPKPYDMVSIRGELNHVLDRYGYSNYAEFHAEQKRPSKGRVNDRTIRLLIDLLKDLCKKDILPKIFHGSDVELLLDNSKIKLSRPKKGLPPCYYIYEGNGAATICVSGEHKENDLATMRTLMHELVPGHHTYYLYKEMLFYYGFVGVEATLDLLYSSETPINEGIAETAPKYLESLSPDLKREIEITTAREHFCKKVLYNVWYHMFIEESFTIEAATEYLRVEGEFKKEKVASWLTFIDEWRIYYPSYPVGTDLVKKGSLYNLYIPKTMASVNKLIRFEDALVTRRRTYEKDSGQTLLCNA